ncbi:MAG: hypothetical protein WAV41_00470 [Microgenomates group bacterium]
MAGNEIAAAADKILMLYNTEKLQGTEEDMDTLIKVYGEFGINTAEKIAMVNSQVVAMQAEVTREIGLRSRTEFKLRTIGFRPKKS